MGSRIAVICNSLDGGGAERACYLLANALSSLATVDSVTMVLFHGGGVFEEELSPKVRRVVQRWCPRYFAWLWRLCYLFRSESRLRSDLVLAFGEWPNSLAGFLAIGRRATLRVIGFEQNVRSFVNCPFEYNVSPTVSRIAKASYGRLDRVVCSSAAVRRSLEGFVPEDRLAVLHNPIDLKAVWSKAADGDCVGFDQGKRNFVAVGRLHRQKDYPTMLRAFDLAFRTDHKIALHILGTGGLEGQLRSLAESLECRDAVSFHGFKRNPFCFMREADALLHSALFEGFGNVFVESLGVGTPVVTTDCDTPREILTDPRLGRIAPVGDAVALADLIASQQKKTHGVSELCQKRAADFDIGVYVRAVTEIAFLVS